jgi:hypothetical protein
MAPPPQIIAAVKQRPILIKLAMKVSVDSVVVVIRLRMINLSTQNGKTGDQDNRRDDRCQSGNAEIGRVVIRQGRVNMALCACRPDRQHAVTDQLRGEAGTP